MAKAKKHIQNQMSFNSLDPQFWSMEWEKAVRISSLARRNVGQDRWTQYWNHISESYGVRIRFESKIIEEIVQILYLERVITKESFILDIGSGPGTFALSFARLAGHVLALDPARKMIDSLMKEARRQGLSNISALCQRWEESHFSKEFDLAFASFSPAIRNTEGLLKMHQASRSYCCLITSSAEENFKMRNEIWERIFREPFHSYGFHILYPFNYLYASGFRPQIRFLKKGLCYEEPIDTLLERYENYFRMFIELTPSKKKIIRQYFEDMARNGFVKTDEEKAIAIMWWSVER